MESESGTTTGAPESEQRAQNIFQTARVVVLGVLFISLSTLILIFPLLPGNRVNVQVGQVATEDILAPVRRTYVSDIETARLRDAAAASVPDIYDAPDARIGRQQVLLGRQMLEFMNTVRHDTLASTETQRQALDAINNIKLSDSSAELLLTMNDSNFESVADEITSVLADVMSGEVREGRVDEMQENLLLGVSVDLPEEYGPVVEDVVEDLIRPNSLYNEELTEQAREAARQSVEPVEQTFAAGEIVVREGEVVTESEIEALEHLDLLQNRVDWREVASRLAAVLLSTVTVTIYLARFYPEISGRFKNQVLGGGLFLLFLLGARLMVPEGAILPYLFPAAAFSLTLTALYGSNVAIISTVVLGGLTGFVASESLELASYITVGGIIAAITLRRADRLNRFFLAGSFVSVGQAVVILVFRLADGRTDTLGLLQLLSAALFNGLLSAGVSLAALFVVGPLFRVTTALSLIELERPDHPLLQRLQREAPGTYQHSLQVRNLAEAGADAIGANSLLVRVGTLYHDVGKMLRPGFFIENRVEGSTDPHETLDPITSADIIIRHVSDGLDLARQHRLPRQIRAFIAEHHGTMTLRPFYQKALDQANGDTGKVDQEAFRYPGPRPQSRETAVLMLADGSESAVRANQPHSEEEIDSIVGRIIEQRLELGELDDSGLTLTDLQTIRRTFVSRLKGVYHPRIRYPGDEQASPRYVVEAAAETHPAWTPDPQQKPR